MKKLYRLVYLAPIVLASTAHAQVSLGFPGTFAGFSSQDLKTTIENIVQIILGFLGIVTVILILYGGFIWMSAFGDSDKIDKAKKLISAGVIGLVVVLSTYGIASFVVRSLEGAV